MRKSSRTLIGALVVGALLMLEGVVVGGAAHAANNGTWAAFPAVTSSTSKTLRTSYFIDSAPGTRVPDYMTVANVSKKPLTLRIYAADAYNAAGNGAFAVKDASQKQTDVGSWISFNPKNRLLTIPVKRAVTFPIFVNIPANATPGDHVGGMVTEETVAQGNIKPGSTGLKVQRAIAVRMYVRVSGDLSSNLVVSKVSTKSTAARFPFLGNQGKSLVTYTILNTGNVRLTPTVTISQTGLFGRTLHQGTGLKGVEIFPGQSVTSQALFLGMPVLDQVTTKVTTSVPQATLEPSAAPAVGTSVDWVISWIFIGLIVLIIALLVFWLYRRRKGRQQPQARGRRGKDLAPTPPGTPTSVG